MDEFFSVLCDMDGERLDLFLTERTGLSRSRVQSLIKDGLITVLGKTRKPGFKLSAGDEISGEIPKDEPLAVKAVNIPLHIVYEDKEVIVVNKTKNMVVHPAPGHLDDTLVNALLFHCGDSLSGINGILRPGIIHRLDKDTTGLIIAAKTNTAHIFLSEQLKNREITRVYEAVVFGEPANNEGIVDAPIGRHTKNRLKMSVTKNGKNAVTHYKVLERFGKYTHIQACLETGRTHQIRVHMEYIGLPLLGDTLYSGRRQPFGLDSQVLHAKRIAFTHPVSGALMQFETVLPDYFKDILERIK